MKLPQTGGRLKADEAAGADALMAPGLPDLEAVRAVCAAVAYLSSQTAAKLLPRKWLGPIFQPFT
jgi:2-methylisocitrate lyase-like PEP mutase family enzyme